MNIQKETVRKHFDRHAHEYDQFANVQMKLLEHLVAHLPTTIDDQAKILEIGCGTGRLTQRLTARFPNAHIIALDLASGMIEEAKKKVGSTSNVTFLATDAEAWLKEAHGPFDLIVSNATFQWFEQAIDAVQRMKRLLQSGAELHFSTLGPSTFWEFHQACAKVDDLLGMPNQRRGQSFVSLEQWKTVVDATEQYYIEYHESVRGFMDSVRRIGASKADDSQTVLTKTYLKELQQAYEVHRTTDDLLPATYHAIYGRYAKK